MVEAYQAEYEHTDISIDALLEKYQLTKDDIKGYEAWRKPGELEVVKPKPRRTKKIDKVLQNLEVVDNKQEVLPTLPPTITTLPETTATEGQLKKIEEFKELALDHCLNFMHRDAKLSEVKEFKDIVAIVNTLETSYQKTDPDVGKPTVNILIQNLVERFQDDC
jgi:hypothetical protein